MRRYTTPSGSISKVPIQIDGKAYHFSSLLLRDACQCPLCVHHTSRQRLFAHVDIPVDLQARSVEINETSDTVSIKWKNDAPTFPSDHTTTLRLSDLRNIAKSGSASATAAEIQETQLLWPLDPSAIPDYDFDAYMSNDETLYQAMRQLRVNGLAFVTNSPQNEEAVSQIATRMGPMKDTFYGATWDGKCFHRAMVERTPLI